MENRKSELLAELSELRAIEIEKQLKETEGIIESAKELDDIEALKSERRLKENDANSHGWVMRGDFFIKFCMAVAISAAFMYITYVGTMSSQDSQVLEFGKSSGHFQLLSVIGPLFGMVLSYYFGKSKSSANGE